MSEKPERTDFELLVEQIESAPVTWIPALLTVALATAARKKCFKDNEALLRFVVARLNQRAPMNN